MARPRPYLHRSLPRPSGAGSYPTHDAQGQPLIRLQTLGAATILVGETRLGPSAGTQFSLLLRLAYAPGMSVARDELLSTLWPGLTDVRRRGNLRQALYKLRLEGVLVAMHAHEVRLESTQVLRTFSIDRSIEAFDRDVTLGHEPFGLFLPGLVVPWPEFQSWIESQREAVHADVRRVLVEQLRRRRDRADWGGAEALARNLLQFDPLNEEATLTLAECTALTGAKAEALAILDRYLAELGPAASDIRLPATLLRKRIAEPAARVRLSFAPTERHFVGRDAELAQLTLTMRRARWHEGSAVLIHGTAGIGKSRLAYELEKVAGIEGIRVVHASCREGDLQRTFSVFLDIIPELMGQSGALGCAPESLAALRRLLPAERVATTADGGVTVLPREPLPSAAALRSAIVDLLGAVSEEKPILLVVDDVHWIDEHSWEALSDLVDRVGAMRVFVLMASREAHARPQRPQRIPSALVIQELPGLTPMHCAELSRLISEDLKATVTDELSEWFGRASEGIPLFLRSLVNHWIETGQAGGVPPSLQHVIAQRLDQLGGDAMRVLQASTLLAKWATVERTSRVLELRANEMLACLEQLESLGLFSTQSRHVLVAHELIGRAARARLSPLALGALQRRVGECLLEEADLLQDTGLALDGLESLSEAGDVERVINETLNRLQAISSFSSPMHALRAIQRLDQEALRPHDLERVRRYEAKVLLAIGDYPTALTRTSNGYDLPTVTQDLTDDEADSGLSFVDSAYRAGDLVHREALVEFACEVAELESLSLQVRRRAADIGLVIASNICSVDACHRLFRATSITESELMNDVTCQQIGILYHTMVGDYVVAKSLSSLLLRRASSGPASVHTQVDAIRAGCSLRIIDTGPAFRSALEIALSIGKRLTLPAHALNAAFFLAQAALDEGDDEALTHYMGEVEACYADVGDSTATSYVDALRCRVALSRKDLHAARAHLTRFKERQPAFPTNKAAAYSAALTAAVSLKDPTFIPAAGMIEDLRNRLDQVCYFGNCDFVAATTIETMFRAGLHDAAVDRFNLFVEHQRRERREWGRQLALVAAQLGLSGVRRVDRQK